MTDVHAVLDALSGLPLGRDERERLAALELEVRRALALFFAPAVLPSGVLPDFPSPVVVSLRDSCAALLLAIANRLENSDYNVAAELSLPAGTLAARSRLFRVLENVGRFNQVCLERGLKLTNTFSASDIENPLYYRRVLTTIVAALQLPVGPPLGSSPASPSPGSAAAAARASRAFPSRCVALASTPASPRQQQEQRRLASSSSPTPTPRAMEKSQSLLFREKCHRTRPSILQEILDTETAYVETLSTIVELFLAPLEAAQLVKDSDVKDIFSTVADILRAQRPLLQELASRYQHRDFTELYDIEVGDLLLRLGELLPLYSVYAANRSVQHRAVRELTAANKPFAAFLQRAADDERCKGLTFDAFLIQPVQRLCRYPLLLGELIKNTPTAHPDAARLAHVLASLQDMVAAVNEEKRAVDTHAKIAELEKALSLELRPSASRRFLREARVKLIVRGAAKPHRLVLFTDVLLVVKLSKRGQLQRLRSRCKLKHTTVVVYAPGSIQGHPFVLGLTYAATRSLEIAFNSEAERASWERDIKQALKPFHRARVKSMSPAEIKPVE